MKKEKEGGRRTEKKGERRRVRKGEGGIKRGKKRKD